MNMSKRLKLKSLLFATAVFAQAVFAQADKGELEPERGSYAIDASHSSIHFKVDHLGFSKVMGRFNEFEGSVNVGEGASLLELNIKTASVDTNHQKRDDHLRSPDFFNAKQFPLVRLTGPIKLNESSALEAKLSLLGVSKPISLSLEKGKEGKDPWGMYRVGYSARTLVKRSDFGMDFMLGGIGDEIEIVAYIEAVKQ